MHSLVVVLAATVATDCAKAGPISTDQWQAIVATGLVLMNALTGYLVFRSHNGNGKK